MYLRNNFLRFILSVALLAGYVRPCIAQRKDTAGLYLQRAKEMYSNI